MITKKDLQEAIDRAIIEIIESISKVVATKDDLKELSTTTKEEFKEVKEEILEVKTDVKDIKRQFNDLKADLPTPQEIADHEKRINKLESAVFPS